MGPKDPVPEVRAWILFFNSGRVGRTLLSSNTDKLRGWVSVHNPGGQGWGEVRRHRRSLPCLCRGFQSPRVKGYEWSGVVQHILLGGPTSEPQG